MQSAATTPEEYIENLPEDRKKAVSDLRSALRKNLPAGFEETITSGMISYVVPHSVYPAGYHCDPKQPLPFISLASQKNFIALYHMGLYATPQMLAWFTSEYPKHSKTKLDMGKSCIRFKKINEIPIQLVSELASKMSTQDWIKLYEKELKKQ